MDNSNENILLLLGKLDGKMDSFLKQQSTHESDIKELNTRVSRLENYKQWLLGAWAVVAAGVGVATAYVLNLMKG